MAHVERLTDDQAVQGYAYPIEVKAYSAGTQLIPTAATITITDPDGTEQVADAAMSISQAGTMTYSLAAKYTSELWEDVVIAVKYTVSTVAYKATFFFDVVLNALECSVIDDDLKAYLPALASENWSTQTTFDAQIQEAFRIIKRELKNRGRRPALVFDGTQVRECIVYKALEIICHGFARATDDIWWSRHETYRTAYERATSNLSLKYDEDESATVSADERADTFRQPTVTR